MKSLSYKSRQSLHMGFLCAFFWFGWAMTNYWSVYLKDLGFDAGMVGIMDAVCYATALATVPLCGIIADKIRSIKKVEAFLLIATVFFWSIVPLCARFFPGTALPFFIAIPLACCFKHPAYPYHENLLVRNAEELGIEFGKFRWIGSLIFLPGSVVIYLVTKKLGYSATYWMFGLCMIPAILLTLTSRDPKGTEEESKKELDEAAAPKQKLNLASLFRSPVYLLFLAFTLLYFLAGNFETVFVPFFMDEIGVGSDNYSLIAGYASIPEIPTLLLMTKLRGKFDHKYLLRLAPLVHLLSCVVYCFAGGWIGLILATTLMGIGNGLFLGSAHSYCYEIAPDKVRASAQGFFATISSVGCILGSSAGGFVMDAVGGRSFFLITGVFFAASAVFLLISGKKPATPLKNG